MDKHGIDKISLYKLNNNIIKIINNAEDRTCSYNDLLEAYKSLAAITIENAEYIYAIQKAMPFVKEGIGAEVIKSEIDEYHNRYYNSLKSEELKNYGYTKPAVLLSKREAYFFFDKDLDIYLAHSDNTETKVKYAIEIQEHMDKGGLVISTPFMRDKSNVIAFGLDDEEDMER